MRKQVYVLLVAGGVFALVLMATRIGNVSLSQASELDFQTPPPPPDVIPTDDASKESPTTVPLQIPLTAEQALAKAMEIDGYLVEREKSPTDNAKDAIVVAQYSSPSEADAVVGWRTWYAPDIEANAGAVWIVTIPGRVRIVSGVPGPGLAGTEAADARWFDGITYQFSARTGEFLGFLAGEPPTQ